MKYKIEINLTFIDVNLELISDIGKGDKVTSVKQILYLTVHSDLNLVY